MAAADQAELKYLGIINSLQSTSGAFKFSKEQLGWQSTDGRKISDVFAGNEVQSAEWQRACGKGYGLLKLRFKRDGGVRRFSGFRADDGANIKAFMKKNYNVTLTEPQVSMAGWTWGDWQADDNGMEFRLKADNKISLEIPLADVGQVVATGKNDVSIDFVEKDNEMEEGLEVLHGMRLFFPGSGPSDDTAGLVRDELVQHTSLSAKTEIIARVADIPLTAPRGKHDFEFFPQYIKIHGKTATYTVKYKSIARLFMVTVPTNMQEDQFVIGLEHPLVQGTQSHNWLVLSLNKAKTVPGLSKERLESLPLSPQVQKDLAAAVSQEETRQTTLVGNLFKTLCGKPVAGPTAGLLEKLNKSGGRVKFDIACVRCNYKTTYGFLYPLKKSMLFVTKPVLWIRYDMVQHVEFSKGLMRTSTFDLTVSVRGSQPVEFAQVDVSAKDALKEYLQELGVKVVDAAPSAPAGRRGPATGKAEAAKGGRKAATASSAAAAEEEYNEDEDEDYKDEDDDDDASGGDDDDDEDEDFSEEEAPKPKRARR
eukprot:TRINITY_DN34213_c0_g1_i1.p1 TRINITY_DN34213_c0_g1~~TRINITY_DN34213_c0_g1_i1.p1  ORF type:complete len:537 (-),score=150.19 TRINITY_DN34213_c0_g1_i1:111-1721(-)